MNRDRPQDISDATWLISGGRPSGAGQPLNVPPVLATNFALPTDASYSRSSGTDTITALETVIGGLEGGFATVFASGMAAAAAVLELLSVGSSLVIPEHAYHGVAGLADAGHEQGRWSLERLATNDGAAWVGAVERADLVWAESPTNPLLEVADLPAICSGTSRKAVVAVDSTFASTLCQRPLDLGADVVMHSATKFFGGHSDLLCGVLITRDSELHQKFRTARTLHGASPGALETWLCLRGMRTLSMRLATAQANAITLAERLATHPHVERVRYPGLPDDPGHALASSFMFGFGAMVSFDVAGGANAAAAVCEATSVIHHATSLGGVETTMERRGAVPGQESIPAALIRMSVGCEDVEDLWIDLDSALRSVGNG